MKIAILAMMVISSLSFAATTPEVCQLAINGRVTGAMIYKTQGSGFFDQASQYAKQHGVCVKASLLWSNNGVRVYSANGARVGGKGGVYFYCFLNKQTILVLISLVLLSSIAKPKLEQNMELVPLCDLVLEF